MRDSHDYLATPPVQPNLDNPRRALYEYGDVPGIQSSMDEGDSDLDDEYDASPAAGSSSDDDRAKELPPARGTADGGYTDNKARAHRWKLPAPDVFMQMSDSVWDVRQHETKLQNGSPYAVITERRTGIAHTVRYNRVAKAKLHLSHDACTDSCLLYTSDAADE